MNIISSNKMEGNTNGKCSTNMGMDRHQFMATYNHCFPIHSNNSNKIHSMAQKYEPGKEFHELLIANYDILERTKNKPYQLTIFDTGEKAEVSNLLKGSIIHYGKRNI